ncbi:DinB family protein [Flavobacterium subsaxonicum]|uniref:Damage-inducible protein DinB n=1 Tax=Flavobacterium subsaxonicum WB 4.1-42 = DSM 21790 TaxID=1121898 RepID=A0A0A2MTH7_9FLAO|nr:DinB family protein [Flavobacterium subsaxonicum]KGO94758.1 damage-inducible protein DinB [Flavobacterium subsaxonicum WB 4.1-42 = DSM 21790]
MRITDIQPDEYAEYQQAYISLVDDAWSLIEELEVSVHAFIKFVQDIPMDKYDYRYAKGKWTIKDIIQHLIDTERIFAYRALRFARNDSTALAGFEENAYAAVAHGADRKLQDMLVELALVRQCTIALFKSFTEEDLLRRGVASGYTLSVRAVGFIIIGHQNHHMKIFKERYLE